MRVCSRSLVIHAWPHDTEAYHSSGKSKLRGRQSRATIDYSGRAIACFHAVQHNMIPLSWVSRKHALAYPSAAREILCDCSTAWRMAREELTGGSLQPQRNSQMEDLEERCLADS
jgi:hypothetical protein